jgi:hypothetical protein
MALLSVSDWAPLASAVANTMAGSYVLSLFLRKVRARSATVHRRRGQRGCGADGVGLCLPVVPGMDAKGTLAVLPITVAAAGRVEELTTELLWCG